MATTPTLPTEVTAIPALPAGGSFLITSPTPASCFFPEDFTSEHQQIAEVTADFALNEILPHSEAIEHKDFSITRDLIKKAAELGLTSTDIPEEYGGLEMDKATSAIIADHIAKQGSFSVAISAHTGIGTLPLVWYGTHEQKTKYLTKIADGTIVAAYALSESTSGSDAVNARTRAVLSEDGQHYILNGEKMWITNGGFADLYTVFAKCLIPSGKGAGEEKLTAFLIERGTPGFTNGPEEHKLGIRGSSTTPLILNDCKIPAANLLGEVGKGHHIAFNILNVGRYKLGNAAVGAARHTLGNAIRYARDRKAFGKSISEFGLIQEKLADMAVGIYVGEALCYRTVGLIDQALAQTEKSDTPAIQRAIESYAVECSIVKVWASEMLDFVVDETVQIFAGYGYVEEFPAERAYRDARINRIFEGTNEINRLIITGRLMKAALAGQLPLLPAIKALMDEVLAGPIEKEDREGPLAAECDLLAAAKKLTLFIAGTASQRYMQKLVDEQEVMAAIADMIIQVFAMESAILRTEKLLANSGKGTDTAVTITRIYAAKAMDILESQARKVIAAAAEGDMARTQFTILRRLVKHDPADTISLRRSLAQHIIAAGKYTL
ncbi:acyl-CoA dehydrogenase family protein [Granulicella tundricola]|uniref:Acyl-CoA dehydrogenase domain-containing protein n=1 Tax=Granulicella tundricola (strain ATCC BAA-1859 / DSM 23138 / MP5ACTX9) TaxID=1198114 RepID=E8X2G1_GRATM|nr:acyl-CoA dehydrogenase family protein [Granulicella tundricola]ADW69185.1 acyl-CoA dehydrogenase domain-containing protein [Granulicella tundricola MP5ACTX9]